MYKISLITGIMLAAVLSEPAFSQSKSSATTTSHPALTNQQLSEELGAPLGMVAGQLQPVINAGTVAAQKGQAASQQIAPRSGGQASSPAVGSMPQIDLMGEVSGALKLAATPHS